MTAYVVTRPFPESNIGSNLASLAGALLLAQRLERSLIVDWRGLTQLRDPELNYFTEFFEHPPTLLGTRVSYAPVPQASYDPDAPEARWLTPNEAGKLSMEPRSEPARYLVVQGYHGPDRMYFVNDGERLAYLRTFYRALAAGPAVREPADRWAEEQLGGSFVVGVNVRTGNGHYFAKSQPYAGRVDVSLFDDPDRFLRLLTRACRARLRRAPREWRRNAKIFYATDSSSMSSLLSRLPNSVTRRTVFPPPGTGDTFRFEGSDYSDRDSVVDTLVDMFLLARCDALVYNTSVFNRYARVVNAGYGGNEVHFEGLLLEKRWGALKQRVRRRLR